MRSASRWRPGGRPGRAAARWWRRNQRQLAPFLLAGPPLLLFSALVLYPLVASVGVSLYDWDGVSAPVWAGLGNYRELLADPVFHKALRNNLLWLLLYFLAPVLGLALALFLHQAMPGLRIARSLFFVPFVLSQVVIGTIFAWFFHSRFGLFDRLVAALGFAPVMPLDSERWAILAVIFASLWPQSAYCMVLYLAGLAALRGELVDAARLDGASGVRLLWHVVLPQLRPATFIVAMVCIVAALRSFDLVLVMTRGGPYDSSSVLAFYMYEQAFLNYRLGYAAAIATVLFALMWGSIAVFLWRMLQRERA